MLFLHGPTGTFASRLGIKGAQSPVVFGWPKDVDTVWLHYGDHQPVKRGISMGSTVALFNVVAKFCFLLGTADDADNIQNITL